MSRFPKMQWNGSRPPEWVHWLNGTGPAPTEMNCWNIILYAAYRCGVVELAYLQRANRILALEGKGGGLEEGVLFADALAQRCSGSIARISGESEEAFLDRISNLRVPRGDVITFGRRGFHVCLSLGGGRVVELDRQASIAVENPEYSPTSKKSLPRPLLSRITRLEAKVRVGSATTSDKDELKIAKEERARISAEMNAPRILHKRPNNEIREKSLREVALSYMQVCDVIYWGPLPKV